MCKLQVKINIHLPQIRLEKGSFGFIVAEKFSLCDVLCFNTSDHTIQMLSVEYFSILVVRQLNKYKNKQKTLVSKIQPRNQSGRKKMYLKTNGFM